MRGQVRATAWPLEHEDPEAAILGRMKSHRADIPRTDARGTSAGPCTSTGTSPGPSRFTARRFEPTLRPRAALLITRGAVGRPRRKLRKHPSSLPGGAGADRTSPTAHYNLALLYKKLPPTREAITAHVAISAADGDRRMRTELRPRADGPGAELSRIEQQV